MLQLHDIGRDETRCEKMRLAELGGQSRDCDCLPQGWLIVWDDGLQNILNKIWVAVDGVYLAC